MDAGDFMKFAHTTAYAATLLLFVAQRELGAARAADARRRGALRPRLARQGVAGERRDAAAAGRHRLGQRAPGRSTATTTSGGCPRRDDALKGARNRYLRRRPVFRANAPGDAAAAEPRGPYRRGVRARRSARSRREPRRARRRELATAAEIFAAAKTTDVTEDDVVTALPHAFYPESSWRDDLELGDAELALAAQALGDSRLPMWRDRGAGRALDRSRRRTRSTSTTSSALAHLRARRGCVRAARRREPLLADLRRQLDRARRTRARRDPFRAAVTYDDFDAAPHAFGLAATAALYRRLTGDRRYDALGTAQRDWALGANAWGASLMIGVGSRFPRCPQHVVANLNGTRHRILRRRGGQRPERPRRCSPTASASSSTRAARARAAATATASTPGTAAATSTTCARGRRSSRRSTSPPRPRWRSRSRA